MRAWKPLARSRLTSDIFFFVPPLFELRIDRTPLFLSIESIFLTYLIYHVIASFLFSTGGEINSCFSLRHVTRLTFRQTDEQRVFFHAFYSFTIRYMLERGSYNAYPFRLTSFQSKLTKIHGVSIFHSIPIFSKRRSFVSRDVCTVRYIVIIDDCFASPF